ncbi:hypothetical protein [Actinomycetospora termitidis]|uniref:Glycosyltransferase RgtA/B/C/D-like domain-containing protein n=1 Tax=Actinomycetospora termitidis TaxID=3053470 RepID=A0ABT7MHQ9_9PSEU|nr:hypothetical protein [Actinomycetospora sp. Odt1-22]MDL5160209.1 hypothetical protein [Actinomycetospora sp. Odt1-22]
MTTTEEAPPVDPGPVRASRPSDTAVAVAVPTVLVALHLWVYGRWIVDDAGITMAYARSISSGLGPVLQPGAPISEGWSDPAWLALFVVARWLGLLDRGAWFGVPDLVAFPKVVAILCCAGIFLAFHRVAVRVSRNPLTTTMIAGTVTAAIPSFVIWAGSGLENPLLALAVVVLATRIATAAVDGDLLSTRVALQCAGLAALASLTRPDGAVYLAAYPLAVWLLASGAGRWRPAGLAVVVGIVPALLYEIWRIATFGELVPTTAVAKQQGITLGVDRPTDLVAAVGWPACLVVVAAIAVLAARRQVIAVELTRALSGLVLVLGLSVLAFSALAADWMAQARFATPVWPVAALVGTLAVGRVVGELGLDTRRPAVVLLVVGLVLSAAIWTGGALAFRARPTVSLCGVALTNGLAVSADADALGIRTGSFLGVDAGGVALSSRLRFIDLAGLTDPVIAHFWRARDMGGLRDHVFDVVRPTFMRLAESNGIAGPTGVVGDPRLLRDYVPLWSDAKDAKTWVRRDAVTTDEALRSAARSSTTLMDGIVARYTAAGPTGWTCPDALRPPPVGAAAAVIVGRSR